MIEHLDQNGDGFVDPGEINEGAHIEWDKVDTDKDGKLSFDELFESMLPAHLDHEDHLMETDLDDLMSSIESQPDGHLSIVEIEARAEPFVEALTHYEL